MKRISIILLSFILVLSMTITSLAIQLPLAMGPVGATIIVTDDSGTILGSTTDPYTAQGSAPAPQSDYLSLGNLQSRMVNEYPITINDQKIKVIGIYDVTVTDGTSPYTNLHISIDPTMNGILPTTLVGLFYYDVITSAWLMEDTTIVDGKIHSDFDNFANPGPMILVVDESTLAKPAVTVADITGKDEYGNNALVRMVYGDMDQLAWYFGGTLALPTGFPSSIINTKYPDITNADLILLRAMDLEPYLNGQTNYPLTFIFDFPSVNPQSKVFVLHSNDGVWVLLDCIVGDGTVRVKFDGLSPVNIYMLAENIVEEEEEEIIVEEEPTVTAEVEDPAPVMGEEPLIYALIIGLIASMGMAIVLKKE